MENKVIQVESNATCKTHTFEILKEGTYNGGEDHFYLVKDQKAKKCKYQIISLSYYNRVFHSSGRVETQEEAEKWFEEYSKRYAQEKHLSRTLGVTANDVHEAAERK